MLIFSDSLPNIHRMVFSFFYFLQTLQVMLITPILDPLLVLMHIKNIFNGRLMFLMFNLENFLLI